MSYDITLLAAPGFMLFILIELAVDRARKTGFYRINDSYGSLTLGIFSKTTELIKISLLALVTQHLLADWSLSPWDTNKPWVWVGMFVLYDFVYYWSHRFRHEISFLWAGHSIHHSSEDYNLTTALRQTSSSIFVWVFSIPAFLLGAPVEAWIVCGAWNLIYQFWVHTRHIKKLGAVEWIMVTPSHHRVHHAQNACYIDKNHGGVFILWDRLFGTFAKEDESEEIIYGVRRALNNFNPIAANFQVWRSLASDAWFTRRWQDKLRIWFMPTGWRPADVEQSRPITKTDLAQFKKYDPQCSSLHSIYALMQLVLSMIAGSLFLLESSSVSYLMGLFAWLLLSAPLVTSAWILEGRGTNTEYWRLLLSWPLFLTINSNFGEFSNWALGIGLGLSTVAVLALSLNKPARLSAAK